MPARILVVEDNPINLRLVVEVLEMDGHTVRTAVDAEQALELLHGEPIDLILMDIALPGMDGLSLTRALKADARFRSLPIVALTAFAMKGDEDRAMEAGCAAYITKPIDTRRLPQQVAEILRRSGP